MVLELANHLLNGGRDALREKTEWVLHSIACRAAIKAGTGPPPMKCWPWPRKLWTAVCRRFVPMAAPACWKLTRKELEKQFGRLV